MKRKTLIIAAALCLTLIAIEPLAYAQSKRAITFDDLISMQRVSDPHASPDGKWVAFTVATPDKEANRNASNIWLVPLAGGEAMALTRSGHDNSPRWSPDGKQIAFLSSRDGESQIYLISVDGGEATKASSISTGVDGFYWAPDSKSFAFTTGVFPDCKDNPCNKKRMDDAAKSKVKARVYDHLLYRHWTHWNDGRRSHLFVMPVAGGTARDLMPGADYDAPPDFRGDANDIAFSPDGRELCFTAVTDPMEAISTNADLFIVPADGSAAPKRITDNPGYDSHPVYSPDGKSIAYRAQLIPPRSRRIQSGGPLASLFTATESRRANSPATGLVRCGTEKMRTSRCGGRRGMNWRRRWRAWRIARANGISAGARDICCC